jgi:hypothetical protein
MLQNKKDKITTFTAQYINQAMVQKTSHKHIYLNLSPQCNQTYVMHNQMYEPNKVHELALPTCVLHIVQKF